MVLNTLWHYTLRLFDKIAIFEKVRKSVPKGSQKSSKLVQNAPWGRPGSIACAICDVLGDVGKSMLFEIAPGSPKNLKKSILGVPGGGFLPSTRGFGEVGAPRPAANYQRNR